MPSIIHIIMPEFLPLPISKRCYPVHEQCTEQGLHAVDVTNDVSVGSGLALRPGEIDRTLHDRSRWHSVLS